MTKDYGITLNGSSYVFYYGDTPQASGSNDKNNVYRTLQFVDGKYKLGFKTQGEAGKTVMVKLQKLTGSKNYVINTTANVGEEVTIPFEVSGGWGEYRLTLTRSTKTDVITVSDLSIHSLTAEEVTGIKEERGDRREERLGSYDLQGRRLTAAPSRPGLYIVNHKKTLVR